MTLRVHPDEIVFRNQNGVLAAHPTWERVRLRQVAYVQNGFAFPSSGFGTTGEIPLIRIRDVGQPGTHSWYSGPYEDAYIVEPGAVIVGMDGDFRVDRWRGPRALLNQRVCKLTIRNDGLYSETFLRWVLPGYLDAVNRETSSVTVKHLSSETIKELPIPLPPRAEQDRIVAAIEEQFSRLDAGVAALERTRQNVRRMRAAVLKVAVEFGQVSGAPMVALGDLVAPGRKVAYGVLVPGGNVADGVPLIRVGDLSNRQVRSHGLKRIDPAIASRYPRTELQGGEVLLSLVGTIGRTAVVPPDLAGANAARALAVIPVRETVDPRYVTIALSRERVTEELTQLSHEVARKTLNLEDVRKYAIPLPGYEEQLEIVQAVETAETSLSAIDGIVAQALGRADHLRGSTLRAAFSGKLVPQDLADESASVLLQRIAAERPSLNGHSPRRGRKTRVLEEEVKA